VIDIILASESPRRSQILEQLGINFQVKVAEIDETIQNYSSTEEVALKLGVKKALEVAKKLHKPALVIGCDTIVSVESSIYGKPNDKEHAAQMLMYLRGRTHQVISGLGLVKTDGRGKTNVCGKTCVTNVSFRDYSDETLSWYIDTGEPMDKAGAYGIQGLGSLLVEKIDGCFFNVMGLPVQALYELFEMQGFKITDFIKRG
jgi:septum formation protein